MRRRMMEMPRLIERIAAFSSSFPWVELKAAE
jgi:hypothetical protein